MGEFACQNVVVEKPVAVGGDVVVGAIDTGYAVARLYAHVEDAARNQREASHTAVSHEDDEVAVVRNDPYVTISLIQYYTVQHLPILWTLNTLDAGIKDECTVTAHDNPLSVPPEV